MHENEDTHRLALVESNAAKLVIKPTLLQAMIAATQTVDCSKVRNVPAKDHQGVYLNRKIQEVKIPVTTRHDVFVHHGHADRCQAVSQNAGASVVVQLGKRTRMTGMMRT